MNSVLRKGTALVRATVHYCARVSAGQSLRGAPTTQRRGENALESQHEINAGNLAGGVARTRGPHERCCIA